LTTRKINKRKKKIKLDHTKKVIPKETIDKSDPLFPYRINLSVGADPDTKGFYSVTVLKSTLSPKDLRKAYLKGVTKLGFDFQKELCTTNENCALSAQHFKKLAASGIPVLDDGQTEGTEDIDFELTLESYRDIWLHISRLGNPQLSWIVSDVEAVPIGGNGLFHDLLQQKRAAEAEIK